MWNFKVNIWAKVIKIFLVVLFLLWIYICHFVIELLLINNFCNGIFGWIWSGYSCEWYPHLIERLLPVLLMMVAWFFCYPVLVKILNLENNKYIFRWWMIILLFIMVYIWFTTSLFTTADLNFGI